MFWWLLTSERQKADGECSERANGAAGAMAICLAFECPRPLLCAHDDALRATGEVSSLTQCASDNAVALILFNVLFCVRVSAHGCRNQRYSRCDARGTAKWIRFSF